MKENFEEPNKIETKESAGNVEKEADVLLNTEKKNVEKYNDIKSFVDDFIKFVVSDSEYQENKKKKIGGIMNRDIAMRRPGFNTRDFLIKYKDGTDNSSVERKKLIDDLINLIEDQSNYYYLDEVFNQMLLKYDEQKHNLFLRTCLSYFYCGHGDYTFEGGEDEGKFTKQIFDKKPDVVFLTARSAIPWGIIYKEWSKSFEEELEKQGREDLIPKIPHPQFKLADVKLGGDGPDLELYKEKAVERYIKKLEYIKIALEKGKMEEPVKIAVFDESVSYGRTLSRQMEAINEAAKRLGIKIDLIKFNYLSGNIPGLPYAIKHVQDGIATRYTSHEQQPDLLNIIDQIHQKINYDLFKEVGRKEAQNISSDSDRMKYFIERIEKL